MNTGKEIKRLRLKARLSAEKAATLIGVDPDRLRKWEGPKNSEPRENDATAIEAFFGVPLDQLQKLESFNFFQKVPHEAEQILQEPESIYESRRSLERTLENLSEDKRESTAIIKRLVTLLEMQFNSSSPGPAGQVPDLKDSKEGHPSNGRLGLGKKKPQANKS